MLSVGTITGIVFEDINGDGDRGDLEPPMPDISVYLDLNQNGELDLETHTIEATGLPAEIADLSEMLVPIEVTELAGHVLDVNVTLSLEHTYIGDLVVTLISPAGTEVTLFSRIGGDADGFDETTLDDQGAYSIDLAAPPPLDQIGYQGRFQPHEALSALIGESPNGTWTLSIRDAAGEDFGSLTAFSLEVAISGGTSEPVQFTDKAGQYQFDDLEEPVVVRQVVPPEFDQTQPASGGLEATPVPGEVTGGFDFGNQARPSLIQGQTWHDLNGDMVRSDDEPGLNDWTIELLDAETQTVVQTAITHSDDLNLDGEIDPFTEQGVYSFDVPRGSYLIREVPQEGWSATFPLPSSRVTDLDPIVTEGTFEVTPPPIGTAESPAPWLPDLIVDMRQESGLLDVRVDGTRLIFGQATPNVGHGPLHLVGGDDNGDGTQIVSQRIFDDHGGFTDRQAGDFVFHPEHNHIHFDDFARYVLREVLPDMNDDGIPEVGDELRQGLKQSFCLINVQPFDSPTSLPNTAADSGSYGCDTEQEISVGWEDIYGAGTIGQEIDIAGLPPGDYWLEATVDPDNHFTELDESNNTGRVLIHIRPADRLHQVTIGPGETQEGFLFGNVQLGSISGRVLRDANTDSVLATLEQTAVAHAAVFVDLNGDHVLNNPTSGNGVADGLAEEPWALTDSTGTFTFEDLLPGEYQIRLVAPTGMIQTTTTPAATQLLSGQEVTGLTFGVAPRPNGTTLVSIVNGRLNVADVARNGKADRLEIGIDSGIGPAPAAAVALLEGPLATVLRIHDPANILTTTVGVQEGLHTVFVPLDSLPDVDFDSPMLIVNAAAGNDHVTISMGGFPGFVEVNGGIGNDRLEVQSGGTPATALVSAREKSATDDSETHEHTALELLPIFSSHARLLGGQGNDTLIGGSGDDTLRGEAGRDSLNGDLGDDVLDGGSDNDSLFGGFGSDNLIGGGGNDLLIGDAGNDSLIGDAGDDTLLGGIGDDTARGGRGSDKLLGMDGDDSLYGDENRDSLSGGDGNDSLSGGADRDKLLGDAGDDTLDGGADRDRLYDIVGTNSFPGSSSGELVSNRFEFFFEFIDFIGERQRLLNRYPPSPAPAP